MLLGILYLHVSLLKEGRGSVLLKGIDEGTKLAEVKNLPHHE